MGSVYLEEILRYFVYSILSVRNSFKLSEKVVRGLTNDNVSDILSIVFIHAYLIQCVSSAITTHWRV